MAVDIYCKCTLCHGDIWYVSKLGIRTSCRHNNGIAYADVNALLRQDFAQVQIELITRKAWNG
jgi:hypothetical protein